MTEQEKDLGPPAGKACEVCGREKRLALGFCARSLTYDPDAKLRCAQLGYERLRDALKHWEDLLRAAEERAAQAERALHLIADLWEGPLNSADALKQAWHTARAALASRAEPRAAAPND